VRVDAVRPCDLDQPIRVRGVARADHEEQVDLAEQVLDGPLPVGSRVADVLLLRRVNLGETPPERLDDLAGLVDRERRLRDVGDLRVRGQVERLGVLHRLDEDRRVRRLAHRSDDLLVTRVPDEQERVSVGGVAPRLDVHLGHEGTGGVGRDQAAGLRVRVHVRGDAVCGEDDPLSLRHVALVVHEDRAARLEVADHVRVMDDLLADVDGRPVQIEQLLDRVDGPLDTGAIPARRRQENALDHPASVVRPRRGDFLGL
jgi:hypothetical protein